MAGERFFQPNRRLADGGIQFLAASSVLAACWARLQLKAAAPTACCVPFLVREKHSRPTHLGAGRPNRDNGRPCLSRSARRAMEIKAKLFARARQSKCSLACKQILSPPTCARGPVHWVAAQSLANTKEIKTRRQPASARTPTNGWRTPLRARHSSALHYCAACAMLLAAPTWGATLCPSLALGSSPANKTPACHGEQVF